MLMRWLPAAVGLVLLLAPRDCLAREGGEPHPGGRLDLERPTGMVEVALGWLLLPGADICVEPSVAGCSSGDSSLDIEAWQLFRVHRKFAAGAGIVLGLTPTTDAPRQDPPGVTRDHARRYFTVESTARYYAVTAATFEAWMGLTAGLVVVSDRFESTEGQSDKALVGPRGVTIRTEGLALGLGVGASYLLSKNWGLGASLRYGSWFLPETPAQSPFGDEASLRGQVNVLSAALTLSYRVPL